MLPKEGMNAMTKNETAAVLHAAHRAILQNYHHPQIVLGTEGERLPDRYELTEIIRALQRILFPGFFDEGCAPVLPEEDRLSRLLQDTYYRLKRQLMLALAYKQEDKNQAARATAICDRFFAGLGGIQQMLLKDVCAGFDGDPAAKSREEVIYCYPGFYAICVYRIAHALYMEDVPLIPRMMTEESHSRTGIDINPGARIGEYFFIDHGTGVVIGETTVIGNNVKLYQGVTLGALSTKPGQALAGVRRHPTVKDNVTIYAGATILGGETVIGEGCVIGGNCFITQPVPPNTKVIANLPELTLRPGRNK